MLAGDYILSIGQQALYTFSQFRDEVQTWGERFGGSALENKKLGLEIKLLRNGKEVNLSVRPEVKTITLEGGLKQTLYLVGISKRIFAGEIATVSYREKNIGVAIKSGIRMVWDMATITLKGFYWIFAGKVSSDSIGGPITMAKYAGETFNLSAIVFIKLIAMISVNLFVLNLIPIPVLDGGQ